MPLTVTNWVDGRASLDTTSTIELVDPATGEPYGTAPDSSSDQVSRAVEVARDTAPDWAATTPRQRADMLYRWAGLIEAERDHLADLEILATGKPAAAAHREIAASADVLRFFAGACRTATGPAAGAYELDTASWVIREPVGVVAAITPWNYPLMMAAWKLGPAVAAGNTVVIKPAPGTPETTRRAASLASTAGIPPGVVNVVCGGPGTGQALVAHPDVAMVAFTGSVETGRRIAANAWLKRTHLELGGNAPVVVFPDADLGQAAADVAAAAFGNAGQSCTAACRVVVHSAVADEFADRLVAAAPAWADGPLHSRNHRDRVHGYIQGLPARSRVLTGGTLPARAGWWYPPTVVAGVDGSDPIVADEVFGPVVTIQTFAGIDSAVQAAAGVNQRLAASVYTYGLGWALTMAAKLPFGWVGINTCHVPVPELPHTGRGDSGRAVDLSVLGLDAYTQPKTVTARVWAP